MNDLPEELYCKGFELKPKVFRGNFIKTKTKKICTHTQTKITQTKITQTKITQTKISQTKITQTKISQTKISQSNTYKIFYTVSILILTVVS